jgi:hypothetical protein
MAMDQRLEVTAARKRAALLSSTTISTPSG